MPFSIGGQDLYYRRSFLLPKDKDMPACSSIRFDHDRAERIGLPEAVFCAGKAPEHLAILFERFACAEEKPILFTRLEASIMQAQSAAVRATYNYDPLSRTAWNRTRRTRPQGRVAIVSAGTADSAVAHEISRTLEYLGWPFQLFEDCGVAGLWRIQASIDEINRCDVVIVVAGLDAALASVVGGLTDKPLFAVPTSVGYGIAQAGMTALHSMLASCAPGIGVLNIDNGYGAACAASRILERLYPQHGN